MNNLSLEITEKAYRDIESITDYIAVDNKEAARKMAVIFYKTFSSLCEYPALGATRADLTELDVRFLVVKKNYLIVYNVVGATVRILRVLTAYQDIFRNSQFIPDNN